MSRIVVDDEGNEETVFTAEELKAQQEAAIAAREAELKAEHEKALQEKDEYVKTKLDQFQKAKGGVDSEKEQVKVMAQEAKRIAEEAKAAIESAKASEISVKKDYWIKSVSGGDVELTKKIEEAYALINLPGTTDTEIQERVQKAVNMAGISSMGGYGMPSFSGGIAPSIPAAKTTEFLHNHEVWKQELGLSDLVPKNPNQ